MTCNSTPEVKFAKARFLHAKLETALLIIHTPGSVGVRLINSAQQNKKKKKRRKKRRRQKCIPSPSPPPRRSLGRKRVRVSFLPSFAARALRLHAARASLVYSPHFVCYFWLLFFFFFPFLPVSTTPIYRYLSTTACVHPFSRSPHQFPFLYPSPKTPPLFVRYITASPRTLFFFPCIARTLYSSRCHSPKCIVRDARRMHLLHQSTVLFVD